MKKLVLAAIAAGFALTAVAAPALAQDGMRHRDVKKIVIIKKGHSDRGRHEGWRHSRHEGGMRHEGRRHDRGMHRGDRHGTTVVIKKKISG